MIDTILGTPGHPGVYLVPARAPDRLDPERLDIVGFVGVAPSGPVDTPVDTPVRITRWSQYLDRFGGFEPTPGAGAGVSEGTRLLPYAVSTFFRQGGQVAYVLRVAPEEAVFFDADPAAVAALAEDAGPNSPDPHVGVDRMARVREIGMLCVPDLAWGLDSAADVMARQERVVAAAERHRRFVALLDVPRGLTASGIGAWRARFDSSFAAAYHPWLSVAGGPGGLAVPVPPSAFAAGIIAERELRLGLPWGPANALARDAVRAESPVTDSIHDDLHGMGINVFRAERDGFRLTAARTLSSDPDLRQLSVRRLLTMLALSLERQTQALAFEPNNAQLRDRMFWLLTSFLRQLARQGAFVGATEAESFFVNCGDDVNPPSSLALGRVIAEIGIAPAAPLEYVLVRIASDPDGNLTVVGDA